MYDETDNLGSLADAREALQMYNDLISNTSLELTEEEQQALKFVVERLEKMVSLEEQLYALANETMKHGDQEKSLFQSIRDKAGNLS